MKKNLQRFGASVLAAAMVAQSVALPAAAETTKIDSSVAQSVAASAASKEIIAKRNQQKEKAKRNSFADGCIA